ncbi:MAG: undecaprenyl-diphosphatase, undecaprenyl-diphosphatase [Candidatus Gottesmanbacteria bacterium GW2011_GWA2_43_14]|uniref:Undecaprenyl-diphosphatase n=1 Tax=Candidatus Gottesmanbacteria bacterium GW2011_GWA2_43_14 TaxID=1618443 RepID=A0A0G1FT00_9BACT|nr:MAG: undecaprenyl-diphosphatase, undecaprenyl-diphosphatase [Candidatus Gottesmanbacteria bacterium GW2011_GWA2_43_14]
MTILDALILSAVEGLTEFLPVSSTGHLILTSYLLKISQSAFVKSFEIIIQLGAILAVATLYMKKISDRKIFMLAMAGFIPTGAAGLFFYPYVKHLFENTLLTVIMLFLGGIIMILLELWQIPRKGKSVMQLQHIGIKKALLIGTIQTVSMVPGVSRAAATIIGGLFLGLNRKTATEYSFILAVPTILAASLLDIFKSNWVAQKQEIILLTAGFAGAYLTALLSIRILLAYLKRHTFLAFGVYRIILAVIFFLIIAG